MENYMISVDWLEVFGWIQYDGLSNPDNYEEQQGKDYYLKRTDILTRSFAQLTEVYTRVGVQTKVPVASIRWQPRSCVLNKHLCIIKINNRVLYSQKFVKVLYDICDQFGITIKGITRLDLCYDCNKMKGGRSPYRFLKQYAFSDQDSPKYIYKIGAKSFRVFASKNPTSLTSISGIEFGSGKSDKRAYIYDKTKELDEVKDKPWIRQAWEDNGLISSEKTHVYRFEISIKSEAMQVVNFNTGELFRLSPKFVDAQENIESLFRIYAAKMFDFRIKGNAERLRDFQKMEIFEDMGKITCKPCKINMFADTGRSEKIVANCLEKYLYKYSDLSEEYRKALYNSIKFLSVVSNLKLRKIDVVKETQYLEAFKGQKFVSSEQTEYLAFVHALSAVKWDMTGKSYDYANLMYDIDGQSAPADSLDFYFQYCEYMSKEGLNPIPKLYKHPKRSAEECNHECFL